MAVQRSPGLMSRHLASDFAAIAVFAAILMWAALWNGFPLIFPDSGVYFGIAYGHDYAIDRSSFYGLILKPLIGLWPNVTGLWVGIFVQCLAAAIVVGIFARRIVPDVALVRMLPLFALLAVATSMAWHTGQYMPDAFTGIGVLLCWLAASRDPSDNGTPSMWLAVSIIASVHYTHIPLLFVVAVVTVIFTPAASGRLRSAFRRGSAALVSVGLAAAILVGANGAALNRWSMTPMAPAFLFARLTEDGLTKPWLLKNCGREAPPELCAIRADIPDDSQILLWDGNSPYTTHIWKARSDSERWHWVDMLSAANRGALAERPWSFIANSAHSGLKQFVSFQAIDDLCPHACWSVDTGPAEALMVHRPDAVAALRASRQIQGKIPRAAIRTITTPIAALSILLIPLLFWHAVRRNDKLIQSLLATVSCALVTNAVLAGAFSAVHDRYQSRLVWIVPLVVALTILRWRQTFRRSRISLPGLK